MTYLLKYLKNYLKECIISPLFKLLEASFELIVPLIVARIVDKGISTADKGYIFQMGGILVLLAAIGLACSLTAQYFAAKAAVGFATDLRSHLFKHINTFSYYEIDKIGTSTLITRITNDVNQVQTCVNLVLRLFLRSPFIVFGAMIMAFTVNVKAALVFVIAIPLLSVVVFGIMLSSVPLYKKVQGKLDTLLLKTRENLTGVRQIRAFCRQDEETKSFNNEAENLFTLQSFVGKISAVLNPLTYVIVNVSLIIILWIGGDKVDTGILTKGEVLALVNYMSQILVELIKLVNLIITFTKSLACANRIKDILEIETSIKEPENPVEASPESGVSIEFKNVNFSYPESNEYALSNLDFKINPNETIGIIGGTGSGKTSLVHLIPRFYDATKGDVFVNDVNVKNYSLNSLRKLVGIVPQYANLFKGSIRENLKWGNENATDEELFEALTISQAKEITDSKDGGLDFKISQGGQNLSGGQKQRFTIARALVKKPSILILDDSASALDYATDAKLRKALYEIKNHCTTIIISQRAASVAGADRIIVLDDGKIAGFDSHENLLKTCDIYREIYESQTQKKEA